MTPDAIRARLRELGYRKHDSYSDECPSCIEYRKLEAKLAALESESSDARPSKEDTLSGNSDLVSRGSAETLAGVALEPGRVTEAEMDELFLLLGPVDGVDEPRLRYLFMKLRDEWSARGRELAALRAWRGEGRC